VNKSPEEAGVATSVQAPRGEKGRHGDGIFAAVKKSKIKSEFKKGGVKLQGLTGADEREPSRQEGNKRIAMSKVLERQGGTDETLLKSNSGVWFEGKRNLERRSRLLRCGARDSLKRRCAGVNDCAAGVWDGGDDQSKGGKGKEGDPVKTETGRCQARLLAGRREGGEYWAAAFRRGI